MLLKKKTDFHKKKNWNKLINKRIKNKKTTHYFLYKKKLFLKKKNCHTCIACVHSASIYIYTTY